MGTLVQEKIQAAQAIQARTYNQRARTHFFEPGTCVLVLLSSAESELLARWQRPYEVIRQVGPVNFEVQQLDWRKKRQVYHVNLLKPWREQEDVLINSYSPDPDLGPQIPEREDPGEPSWAPTPPRPRDGKRTTFWRPSQQSLPQPPEKPPGCITPLKLVPVKWRVPAQGLPHAIYRLL